MAPVLEVRDLRFDLASVPKHWHGGRRSITLFFNNLSVLFPPGERFFIASVKHYAKDVTDPALKAEVDAFCAQEGHHSREHVRYNRMLVEQGYPVDVMEKRVERLLALVTRRAPPLRRLAVTCALEHFTALMASLVLADERVMAGAHPQLAALWRWHAAEENEHKAVAFDVFRAVGGTWWTRCLVMFLTTVTFWFRITKQQVGLMRADGILFSLREWWSLFRYLFFDPGGLLGLWRPYLSYYRPRFHPWEHDTSALIDRWKGAASH